MKILRKTIPFFLKDKAKSLGATWDPVGKQWCLDLTQCSQAALVEFEALGGPIPEYEVPTRMIYPELIPSGAWYSNLRNAVTWESWSELRNYFMRQTGGRCSITGGSGVDWGLELHEHWEFDEETGVQTLAGFSLLTPEIHECMHPGFAQINGRIEMVVHNMVKYNSKIDSSYTRDRAIGDLNTAFSNWKKLSLARSKWKLNLDLMKTIDMNLNFKYPSKKKVA